MAETDSTLRFSVETGGGYNYRVVETATGRHVIGFATLNPELPATAAVEYDALDSMRPGLTIAELHELHWAVRNWVSEEESSRRRGGGVAL